MNTTNISFSELVKAVSNDKFKKFLESVKVTKDNFYTIMPIQNMKTRPNAVYNFN